MSTCGVHIGSEYIILARRSGAEVGVDSISIQPLDTHASFHEAVRIGFEEMLEKEVFAKKEEIHLAFHSGATHLFHTSVATETMDTHEMMSWELMIRVNDPVGHYAFDAVPAGAGKSIGVAIHEDEIAFYKKLCKKSKLQLASLDAEIFALYNLYELNYDSVSPALLLIADPRRIALLLIQNKTISALYEIAAYDEQQEGDREIKRIYRELDSFLTQQRFSKGVPIYISGELLSDLSIRSHFLKTLPNSTLLNPFKEVPSRSGMDDDSIERFSPLISVAVGLSQREQL